MKKVISKILLMIFVLMMLFSVSACNFMPETLGDPLGMYLYSGTEKMLLDGSESKQIVEQIEFDGVFYDIINTDYYYVDDYFYFCVEFETNNYIGLFRYSFIDKQTGAIYIKNISDKTTHTQFKIYHITNYFITLQQCELDSDGYYRYEYYSVDYSGNIIETGFDMSEKNSDEVAYTDSYKLTRKKVNSENIFEIEHLITHEKIILGSVEDYYYLYGLNFYETEDIFCLVTYTKVNTAYTEYFALYQKETKTLYSDFLGISGNSRVLDINYGLFYFNNNIYQFQSDKGFVLIRSLNYDYKLYEHKVLHNGILALTVYKNNNDNYSYEYYFYDLKTNQYLNYVPDFYSYEYFFDGYVFFITEISAGWSNHYYLNRVCLETQKSEIVYYSANKKIIYDRIDY